MTLRSVLYLCRDTSAAQSSTGCQDVGRRTTVAVAPTFSIPRQQRWSARRPRCVHIVHHRCREHDGVWLPSDEAGHLAPRLTLELWLRMFKFLKCDQQRVMKFVSSLYLLYRVKSADRRLIRWCSSSGPFHIKHM